MSRSEAISAFGYDAEDIDREIAADNARADAWGWSSSPTPGTTNRRRARPGTPPAEPARSGDRCRDRTP
jgi:capsid protein